MLIPLTQGKSAIIDDEDWPLIANCKWCVGFVGPNRTYPVAMTKIKNSGGIWSTTTMHRVIMRAQFGEMIDHRNRNRLDNRRYNLRRCTHQGNRANSPATGKSGLKGVRRSENGERWLAQIHANGKQMQLGTFRTAKQAARAYDRMALKYFGEFARINGV